MKSRFTSNPLRSSASIRKPVRQNVGLISKGTLDKLIDRIRRERITLTARPPSFQHPWSVIASWLPKDAKRSDGLQTATFDDVKAASKEGIWSLQVIPGFVNGTPVRVSVKASGVNDDVKKRIGDARGKAVTEDEYIDVPLTDFPYLTITKADLRPVGYGATSLKVEGRTMEAAEVVPQTFIAMGVKDSVTNVDISLAGGVKISGDSNVDLKETRILRACDLVLKVERASLKFDIEKGNPYLDGYSQIVTPRYARNSKTRRYASLFITQNAFIPPQELEGDDLLSLAPADAEYDYKKIATIYFVSPFDTDPTADLDQNWQVEVKYNVFWNLCYMPAAIPPMLNPDPIRFFTALGLGIASPLINSMLAPINDATSRFMATLRAKRQNGVFWST